MISDFSSRFCRFRVLHFLLYINVSLYNEVQSSSFHSERHRSPLPKWTIVIWIGKAIAYRYRQSRGCETLASFFLNDLCFSLDNRRLACYFLTSSFLGRDFEVPVRQVSLDSLSHFQIRKVVIAAKSLQRCRGRFVRLRRPITIVGRRIHVVRTPKKCIVQMGERSQSPDQTQFFNDFKKSVFCLFSRTAYKNKHRILITLGFLNDFRKCFRVFSKCMYKRALSPDRTWISNDSRKYVLVSFSEMRVKTSTESWSNLDKSTISKNSLSRFPRSLFEKRKPSPNQICIFGDFIYYDFFRHAFNKEHTESLSNLAFYDLHHKYFT